MFHDIWLTGYEEKLAVISVSTLISKVDTDGLGSPFPPWCPLPEVPAYPK